MDSTLSNIRLSPGGDGGRQVHGGERTAGAVQRPREMHRQAGAGHHGPQPGGAGRRRSAHRECPE